MVVDGVTGADDIEGTAHLADDLLGGIRRLQRRGDDDAGIRRVRGGFEHERHARQVAGGGVLEELHAGGQALQVEAIIAADAVTREVLEQHHAAAARDGHELAEAAVVDAVIRRSEGEARLGGDHLDTVDEVGSAAFEVVRDADRVDAVDGRGELEAGIEATHAATVIVADDRRRALRGVDVDDRIKGRTQHLGERAAFEDLTLLERHAEVVDVARLLDDTVERVGVGRDGEGSLLKGIVRLGLERVVDGRKAEEVAGRSGGLGLRVEDVFGVVFGRQRHLLGEGITGLDEPDAQLRAELAAGGIDRVRTAEVADVQAVVGIAGTAVGGFADHHVVVAVVFGDEGAVAVLAVQDRVIREGLLELVLVEDRDVRVERALRDRGQAESVDLDADALALLDGDLVVIDVFGEHHSLDGLVQRNRLGGGEFAVRLLLLHVREGAREELAHVRDAGLRAHAHDVVAGADARVDGQGQFDLVRRAAFDGLHLEARRVEHQVLEIIETGAAERQFDVGADLAAVRLQRGYVRIGRPGDERGGEERGKVTELHKTFQRGAARPPPRWGRRMGIRRRIRPASRS